MKRCALMVLIVLSVFLFSEEKLLDLSFFQTDIRDALTQISYEIGKPIIYDRTVTGFVSLEVYQVPVEKALDLLLLPYGYQWVEIDGVYFVGSPDPESPSFFTLSKTYLYRTKGNSADQLIKALPPVMKNYVFPLSTDTVVINAPPKIASKIAETLNTIDVPEEELILEVKVVEVNEETLRKWGISWQYSNQSEGENFTINLLEKALDIVFNTLDYSVLSHIELSIGDGSAKLLANPRLRLQSGSSGKFSAKTQRNYITTENDKKVVKSVELGTEVEMKPFLLRDNTVSLTVKITSSNALDKNEGLPDTTSQSIEGTVRLKLGETVAIGGIGFDTYTTVTDKVPLLGDIPVFGYLFKKETERKIHKEILILVKCTKAGESE